MRRTADPDLIVSAMVDEGATLQQARDAAYNRELVARVRAVLRRAHGDDVPPPHEIFDRGRLRIDFDTYEVAVDGEPVTLSFEVNR